MCSWPRGRFLAQIMAQHHIQPIVSQCPGDLLHGSRVIRITPQPPFNRRQCLVWRVLQVAALRRVAPVAVYIHMLGNVVEDLFVGTAPLDDDEYILFMAREHRHLASFPSLAIFDMHKEGPILSRIHIKYPQIAEFCPAQSACLCKSDMRLPMRRLEVPIMAGRTA